MALAGFLCRFGSMKTYYVYKYISTHAYWLQLQYSMRSIWGGGGGDGG